MEGSALDGTEVTAVTVLDKPGHVLARTALTFWWKKTTMNHQGRLRTSAAYTVK